MDLWVYQALIFFCLYIKIRSNGGLIFVNVELVEHTENPELNIARAAAISYDNKINTLEDARKLNKKLVKQNHMSPVEFATAHFIITNLSRVAHTQLVRHRLASFMVQSFRYTEPSDNIVYPPSISKKEVRDIADRLVDHSFHAYDQLQERGIPKEDARFFLPMGTATKMHINTNFRHFYHIFKERALNDHAQWEIREITHQMLMSLISIAPSIFGGLVDNSTAPTY